MFKKKNYFLLVAGILALMVSGCNLKVDLNSNLNESKVSIENAEEKAEPEKIPEEIGSSDQLIANQEVDFVFETADDGLIKGVKLKNSGEPWIESVKALCGNEMVIYAHSENSMKVILAQYNPGSDRPVRDLYSLYLQKKTCSKLAVSENLKDFGERILSPDKSKLAVALETDEAKKIDILDLLNDQAKTVVRLEKGETLNGGYGALSNHFQLSWIGNDSLQYTVYRDTVSNYPDILPEKNEEVLEVRIVKIN